MSNYQFARRDEVKSLLRKDRELCKAIDESLAFFSTFVDAFSNPDPRQVNFEAVVLNKAGRFLEAFGVAVEKVSDQTFEGRLLPNSPSLKPSEEKIKCAFDQVIDLRYLDTFELEGAYVYKELLQRQPDSIIGDIWEEVPFLLEWDKEKPLDPQFRDLMRNIANHRTGEVVKMLKEDRSLGERRAFAARPGHTWHDPSATLLKLNAAQYAAEFGNREIINAIYDAGVLDEDPGGRSPLCWAALRGNLETTTAMLDLGFDIEVTDEVQLWPLYHAVTYNREDIIDLLLDRGADLSRLNNRNRNVLFTVESVNVATKLIESGASLKIRDDQRNTCADWHNNHGRLDLVACFVEHGASVPSQLAGLTEQEVIERGKQVIQDLYETDPELASILEGDSVDYGYVLPVKSLCF